MRKRIEKGGQTELSFGAGYVEPKRSTRGRPVGKNPRPRHRPRPFHDRNHPVHVTMRVRRDLPSLRWRAANAIERSIGKSHKESFRVIQYSIQPDHIHLVVEAEGRITLMRGIRGLAIRMAKAINFDLARRGPVFADRYHARPLRTPREVRNALVYVINNWRKHVTPARGIDALSSARWFDGWKRKPPPPAENHISPPWEYVKPLVRAARTWLAGTGWRRHGLLHPDEQPAS